MPQILDKNKITSLKKEKVYNDKYEKLLSNPRVYIGSIILFFFSFIYLVSQSLTLHLLEADIYNYQKFEKVDYPMIKYTLQIEPELLLWDDVVAQLARVKQTLPSLIKIYNVLQKAYTPGQINLDKITREDDVLVVDGSAINMQSYSFTAITKMVENLNKYNFFKLLNINNLTKQLQENNSSESRFRFTMDLQSVSPIVDASSGEGVGFSFDIEDRTSPEIVQGIKKVLYKIEDQYVVNISWDEVRAEDFAYYLVYKGDKSDNLKLYAITNEPTFQYTTFAKENMVFQVFALDQNMNKSGGSKMIEIDTSNIEYYEKVDTLRVVKETVQNSSGIITNNFYISWKDQGLTSDQEYIVVYSLDNERFYYIGSTKNTEFEYSSVDLSGKYYFDVLYIKR